MSDLEQMGIERMKLAAKTSEKFYSKPLVICYSGGKDSDIILTLALRAGIDFEVVNSHTTADAPETVYHIRKRFRELQAAGYKATISHPVKNGRRVSMWSLIPEKRMPPTRMQRYCCAVLKETYGSERVICTGVRAGESYSRSKRAFFENIGRTKADRVGLDVEQAAEVFDETGNRKMIEHCYQKRKAVFNPIIDWSDSDVWEYIEAERLDINPLYLEGWYRVGCIGCPMADRLRYKQFARWPKYKQLYLMAFEKMVERQKAAGKTRETKFTSAEAVFRWWIEDDTINGQMRLTDDGDIEEERW